MNTTESKSKTRNPLPWILAGAVLAPLIILLFSHMNADPEMRDILILLLVPLIGAVAGWAVYALNPLGRPRGWRKSILLLIAILVYSMAVLFGFAIARIAAF